MICKFTFDESIKRIFFCITNNQIICHQWLKDYISDIKIINEPKKKEASYSRSMIKNNITDSSQNLINMNNIGSKTNISVHPGLAINNSFLFLNSSLNTINFDKLEGLIFECKWKKKYILTLKIIKIHDSEKFFKSIDIECLEMNHYEKAFNLQVRLYWNSYALKTHLLFKFRPKDKIIEEIINREFNKNDKKRIYNLLYEYLLNDLSSLENCLTCLIFASTKDVSFYIRDIRHIIRFDTDIDNKKLEFYQSSLIPSVQNCKVIDPKTNKIVREYIFVGYFADIKKGCQIRWEKRENNKTFCLLKITISYLEENISLIIFKNVYQSHTTTQYLSDVNARKKLFFNELKNYFYKKNNKNGYQIFDRKNFEAKLMMAVKTNIEENEENNELNLFMNNQIHNMKISMPNEDQNQKERQNSLMQTFSLNDGDEKESDNLFGDSINISEIKNNNSTFLVLDEDKNIKN